MRPPMAWKVPVVGEDPFEVREYQRESDGAFVVELSRGGHVLFEVPRVLAGMVAMMIDEAARASGERFAAEDARLRGAADKTLERAGLPSDGDLFQAHLRAGTGPFVVRSGYDPKLEKGDPGNYDPTLTEPGLGEDLVRVEIARKAYRDGWVQGREEDPKKRRKAHRVESDTHAHWQLGHEAGTHARARAAAATRPAGATRREAPR